MQKPITITWSINGESDYNDILQCAAKLFHKKIESLEKEKKEEIGQKEHLKERYENVAKSIAKIKAILNRHKVECSGEDLHDAIAVLETKLDSLDESEEAFNCFRSMLTDSQDIDGWDKVIKSLKNKLDRYNDINSKIDAILKDFEIKSDEDFSALYKWMDAKRQNAELSAEAKKRICEDLGINDNHPDWKIIEETIADITKLRSQNDSLIKQCAVKDELVSKWIYERIDQIGKFIQNDINSCDNQSFVDYINEFMTYNKERKQNQDQKFKRRDLSELIPIFNMVWWGEQEELKPYVNWCKSITEISKQLQDICKYFELLGYTITIPSGRMSIENMSDYNDVKANPERYYKIFTGSNYPAPDYYCMIDRLALIDVHSKEVSKGACFRFHK